MGAMGRLRGATVLWALAACGKPGATPDAGAIDATAVDASVDAAVPYVPTLLMTNPYSTVMPTWASDAQAFITGSAGLSVQFSMTTGVYWDTIGAANAGSVWTADGALAACEQRQDYLLSLTTPGYHIDVLGLDLEGPIVAAPSYSSRMASDYDARVTATQSVVDAMADRYGPGTAANLPVAWYNPGTEGPYWFAQTDLQGYRSATYPTGFPFTQYDLDEMYRWDSLMSAFIGGYYSNATGAITSTFVPFDDPARSFTPGLGPFALEYASDREMSVYGRPEWQPILGRLDMLQPTFYPFLGWPNINQLAQTLQTTGPLAGLGGESGFHYYATKAAVAWTAAQTDRPRKVIPFVSGELYNLRFPSGQAGTLDDHDGGLNEVWDSGWVATYGGQWLDFSMTHVSAGQPRVRYLDFANSMEAIKRGAIAGGRRMDGVFYWEAHRFELEVARQYLANGRTEPDLRDSFLALRRIAMHEWAIEMPGDKAVLDPLFGGNYDRVAVWGPFVKPETDWTVTDIDQLAPLLWKVRVQPYLELARSVMLAP